VRADAVAVAALLMLAGSLLGRAGGQAPDEGHAVFVGAGDIANCESLEGARATSALLDVPGSTVFTLGDHVYPAASPKGFRDCYGPTWGRYKARTRPAIGNHDLAKDLGRSYFDYFGELAGPKGRGFYSFDLAAWHVVSLNSAGAVGPHSPQMKWLRDDLAAHPAACVLAYWHIPKFSSGGHGSDPTMDEAWHVLYQAGADVVLNGHAHDYERFAPQSDKGRPDPSRGIREFVVGTGGGEPDRFGRPAPNSEVRETGITGVLKLTLKPGAYTWEFLGTDGETFRDSGEGRCSPLF
jgi:calcineurin-like phosphoesterase family protein